MKDTLPGYPIPQYIIKGGIILENYKEMRLLSKG